MKMDTNEQNQQDKNLYNKQNNLPALLLGSFLRVHRLMVFLWLALGR